MTHFHRSIAPFAAFPRLRTLRWLPMFAALAAVAAPGSADAARRTGAYDGTWNVVFATKRGNCSSGYSVPFTVLGRPGFIGGRRQGLRLDQSRGRRRGRRIGRSLQGKRRWPARRQ